MSIRSTYLHYRQIVYKWRFHILFVALLFPYALNPIASSTELFALVLLDISFSLVLFMGILAISGRNTIAVGALAMVLVTQALTWTSRLFSSHILILAGIAMACIYLIYTAVILLIHVLKNRSVHSDTIFAALCVYLLIGYIWAFSYSFIDDIAPNTFQVNATLFPNQAHGHHIYSQLYYFIYFSFTTLTTLGFGDIIPAAPVTRVLASLESVAGQLYLVVLVSRLVGLHINQTKEEKK
jgi:hypothetical protein